ncbi:hypothetical protein N9U42_02380 [Luminiphilus sp.]|nr:hypothetical protein [Luminiphilus sp.]MDA9711194.1 hypothetical protein [Luminiphilus sp.]
MKSVTYTSNLLRASTLVTLLAASTLFHSTVWGWSDHSSLVWPLIREQPQLLEQRVVAEPLADFVRAERVGIARTLARVESWAIDSIAHYPPTPESLLWRVEKEPAVDHFLAAIRVNPLLPYGLFVDVSPERTAPDGDAMDWSALSFLGGGSVQAPARYWPLRPGQLVSIAEVVSGASDEPDFGMDVGLFEDNGTEFGRRYGFGKQPFGNPNLDYGSQAPFHMGFYHLDWLTRTVQPGLLRTYPLWRIALFGELAELAFVTGHDYWGWRFLGWGLHYVGDLTQPYHAIPLPGVGIVDALWSVVQGKTGELVQLVSNRHGVIESYQYQRLTRALEAGQWRAPLLRAVSDHGSLEPVTYAAFVANLTADSVAAAGAFDAAIAQHVPARFVSDPAFEWTGSGYERDIISLLQEQRGDDAIRQMDAAVIAQLKRFSRVASRWIARGDRTMVHPRLTDHEIP